VGRVVSVNLAIPEANLAKPVRTTGINKRPAEGPVLVRAPGPKATGLGSGLVGDRVFDVKHHGGDDQAVYAFAREEYDWWEAELGRSLASGVFGDNLTTEGVDVDGAVIGERWAIGSQLVLQATFGRVPCATFQAKMGEPRWVKRFTAHARPGTYLQVVEPGEVSAGDEVTVIRRPGHGVTIAEAFRAWLLEPALLPRLLEPAEVSEKMKEAVRQRLTRG
jgi:MOSC domain-containing protein YiiM